MRYVEVGTKPGSDTPHHIRVSPKGDFWYVIFINNNIMQKFRCSDDSHVADIPLSPLAAGTGVTDASNWNTFAISPDGRKAYCVSWTQNGSLASVDLERGKLLTFLGGQHYPHAVALSKSGDRLFVGAHTGNFITAFDTSLQVEGTRYSLDPGVSPLESSSNNPHDMVLSPDGGELWITCLGSKDVRVFSTASNSVTGVIPAAGAPFEIVYSASTGEYFASCTNDSLTFPGHTGTVTRIKANGIGVSHLAVGHQPHGLAVDERRRVLYVLSRNLTGGPPPHHSAQCAGRNGYVQFVDLDKFTVREERYELSVDPYFIFARP
jgi:YVTN family beta-propeller protein